MCEKFSLQTLLTGSYGLPEKKLSTSLPSYGSATSTTVDFLDDAANCNHSSIQKHHHGILSLGYLRQRTLHDRMGG